VGFSKHFSIILNSLIGLFTILIGTFLMLNKLLLEGMAACVIGILLLVLFHVWKSRQGVAINDLPPWIYFNRLMERWKLSRKELHNTILNTQLRGKRYVDYTDYASSQTTPYIVPVKTIEIEFDIIDDRLCFKRKDIEEFEKNT